MVKLNEEKLYEQANIEPIDLDDPAPINHGDQIYVVQHPNGRKTEFSSSPCTVLGK